MNDLEQKIFKKINEITLCRLKESNFIAKGYIKYKDYSISVIEVKNIIDDTGDIDICYEIKVKLETTTKNKIIFKKRIEKNNKEFKDKINTIEYFLTETERIFNRRENERIEKFQKEFLEA